ncbi:MAG: DUF3592 domain-containing protein [Candidatus Omnitrophica bacterium]|jgi:hypothetical protein|nr:DUF3592 domain-containing protein [Candidatus Omnitrophota bacterium]
MFEDSKRLTRQEGTKRRGSIIFRIILFFVSIAVLLLAYNSHKEQFYIYNNFRETKGTLLSNSTIMKVGSQYRSSYVQRYYPVVSYKYQVGASTYTGNSICEPELAGYGTHQGADNFLKKYKVGTKCPVYYDPKKPFRSVLIKRNPYSDYIIFLVVAAVIWVIIIFYREEAIESFRNRAKKWLR